MIYTFRDGEAVEGEPWEIETDVEAGNLFGKENPPCKHAVNSYEVFDVTVDGEKRHPHQAWALRAVVRARNEGGFNCTAVCLDCILDAVQAHGLAEKVRTTNG